MVFALAFQTALLLSLPIGLGANKKCISDDILQVNLTYHINTNGNATSVEIAKEKYCPDGCSYTLNDCRSDPYTEAIYAFILLGGVLVYCMISLYTSVKTGTGIYVLMLLIASLLVVVIALTDVFSTMYRTIFLGFAFIPASLIAFAYMRHKKEKRENLEAD